jgi:hypothetical protein
MRPETGGSPLLGELPNERNGGKDCQEEDRVGKGTELDGVSVSKKHKDRTRPEIESWEDRGQCVRGRKRCVDDAW